MLKIAKEELSEAQQESIYENLTHETVEYQNPKNKIKSYFFHETESDIFVPKYFAFEQLKIQANVDIDEYPNMQKEICYTGTLQNTPQRPQIEPTRKTYEQLKKLYGALLISPPGTGKTEMAIKISCDLGKKCFILAHKDDLINQWIERIKKCVSSHVRIGKIKCDECDFKDCDFVVCSMQSLYRHQYNNKDIFNAGLLIIDEAHHLPSESYQTVFKQFSFCYSLGLTGTFRRSDRKQYLIPWLIGSISVEVQLPPNENVEVNMIDFTMGKKKEIKYRTNQIALSSMISALTKEPLRNTLIIDIIKLMYHKQPHRKGLLLSHRVEHLKQLYRDLDPNMCAIISSKIHTNMTNKERASRKRNREPIVFEKFLTLSTYDMFSEAIDFDGNFIILATPKPHVEQSTGRIMRGRDISPVIFDIVDNYSIFEGWKFARSSFYTKNGYKVLKLTEKQIYDQTHKIFSNKKLKNVTQ